MRVGRGLTRRAALAGAAAAAALPGLKPLAWAAGRANLHGLSIFGELKYAPGFAHFDYLDPDAPKGGRMNFQPGTRVYNQNFSTFNTLNTFILKGDAPPRMELCFDTLMTRATDEPDAVYGLIAESVSVSDDANVFTFALRPDARFHDGSPLSAEDVAFSLQLLKDKGHPNIAEVMRPLAKAEASDARTLTLTLDGRQNRETIFTLVTLPVFSKAYYSSKPFDSSTLEAPLGCGPYKVGRADSGRTIEFARVPDYWGAALAVNAGANNFDTIRIDFYQERQAAFEAFKKGNTTFREEATSITWAQGYDFPAVTAGKVKKTLFPGEARPSFQGFFYNCRRSKFADPRTRLALSLAFDFEWSNRNLFFDGYERISSYFQKSDFAAAGPPSPDELTLLEPYRADLPAEAFGEAYVAPKSDGSGRDRKLLKQAVDLLSAAGWKQQSGGLVNAAGERLTVEYLIDASVFERVLTPYIQNLKAIGAQATIRQVDPSQYAQRVNIFDYDVILAAMTFPATPLDGFQQLYGSAAADQNGSDNFSGIKSKAVDGLIARLPQVTTREELVTLLRALDRVLRAGQYWLPSWYLASHRVAHWDIFGWPATKPEYDFAPETTWWFEKNRATAIGMAG